MTSQLILIWSRGFSVTMDSLCYDTNVCRKLHAFCKNQWITFVHRNTRQIQVNIKSLGLPNRLSRSEDVTHRMTLKQWETSKQTNKNWKKQDHACFVLHLIANVRFKSSV